jgi:hypothetical protein
MYIYREREREREKEKPPAVPRLIYGSETYVD